MDSKKVVFIGSAVFLVFLCGCAALDTAFGIDPATGEQAPGGGPAGTAGGILGLFGSWGGVAGTALGAIGTLYSSIRSRNYARAASSVVRGVSALREQKNKEGRIALSEQTLMDVFSSIQDEEKTRKIIGKLVLKQEKKKTKEVDSSAKGE